MKFNVNFSQKRNEQNIIHNFWQGHFFSQINLLPAFPQQTTEKNQQERLFKYACIFISFNILIMTIN